MAAALLDWVGCLQPLFCSRAAAAAALELVSAAHLHYTPVYTLARPYVYHQHGFWAAILILAYPCVLNFQIRLTTASLPCLSPSINSCSILDAF